MRRSILVLLLGALVLATSSAVAAPSSADKTTQKVTVIKAYQVGCEIINQGITITGDGYTRLHGLSNRAVEVSPEPGLAGEVINELDMMINQANGNRLAWGTFVIKPTALGRKDRWEGSFTMTVAMGPDGKPVSSSVQAVADGKGVFKGKTMVIQGQMAPAKMAELAPYCGGKPVTNAVEQTIWIIE